MSLPDETPAEAIPPLPNAVVPAVTAPAAPQPVAAVTAARQPAAPVVAGPQPAAPIPRAPTQMTAAARMGVQQRAERLLARAVPQLRYQLMRLGPAGLSGLAVGVAAAVVALVLLLPAQQSVLALRTELTKGHAVSNTQRPEQTPRQFAAELPTREQIPALLGVILVQATDSNIVLEQGKYTFSPSTSSRLARYTFEFPVKADYGSIRTFINKSLAAVPALGLDKLHVERKNVGDTLVSANVGFVIYLRGG